jgi:hypothetical protein
MAPGVVLSLSGLARIVGYAKVDVFTIYVVD